MGSAKWYQRRGVRILMALALVIVLALVVMHPGRAVVAAIIIGWVLGFAAVLALPFFTARGDYRDPTDTRRGECPDCGWVLSGERAAAGPCKKCGWVGDAGDAGA